MNTLRLKIIKEKKIICTLLIIFLLATTLIVKSSPIIFCNFVSWLGKCEDCYGKKALKLECNFFHIPF